MGLIHSPSIVRDGLVLHLDAPNSRSYSRNRFISYGSGTVTENVTFANQGTGTFQRVGAGTVVGGYTIKPTDVVYSYALGTNGCHYHGNTAGISSGSWATFSFDYLVTGATTYPDTSSLLAVFENYGGGGLGGSISIPNNLQDTWQRVSFTSGPTTASGTQAMFLYPGGCGSSRLAATGTIYYRNPKVEWTNVDTGNETFSSTTSINTWYDLSGRGLNATGNNAYIDLTLPGAQTAAVSGGAWTTPSTNILDTDYHSIFFMLKFNSSISWSSGWIGSWEKMFTYAPAGTDRSPGVWRRPSERKIHWRYDPGNSGFDFGINGISLIGGGDVSNFDLNTWYYIGVTKSGPTLTAYVNGSRIGSTSTGVAATKTSGSATVIINESYTNPLNNINAVKVYNRVLTASEVLQNFNAIRGRYGI